MARTIAILTGTRADYGLLKFLARAVAEDPRTELQLIVSGSHLSSEHGSTASEIEFDELPIAARVPIWSGDDEPIAAAGDTGAAVKAYAEVLGRLDPEVVVVLGDRLEALAMALAATVLGIPVAHVHGGELTEGAMDDSLRHAITKLSHLHFVTTPEHRARVIQLGESPDRVHLLGAPVLDAIAQIEMLSPTQLSERFDVEFDDRTVVMTMHPAAFDAPPTSEILRRALTAIERTPDIRLVITGTNSDIGSDEIRSEIFAFVAAHADRAHYVESFGQLAYLSAVRASGAVIGNSSSTVLEAPLLGTPSILLGDRQFGRPLSESVLTPESTTDDIHQALQTALSRPFRERAQAVESVFGSAGFAERSLEVLATFPAARSPRKRFRDIPMPDGLLEDETP
ncbi:hypothetical protein ASE14_05380 [Agromyces sp. Root81]|uniref:UDP-N-acetylglucosamine 2-epimerase n=1 Tax=Agromyces sp. Root81 TaxID=1736601 RepID=UPI0006F26A14|nr:UDP-N-acetylglucosamine 2-epimerase [Agromyces sp. Root81]KRC60454.1 hypothetical protein ASE14_05380 [Agromyces sp. Root81]